MSSPDALDTAGLDLTLTDTQAIDDCWNRIGIHGDKSCPLFWNVVLLTVVLVEG